MKLHQVKVGSFLVAKQRFLMKDEGSILLLVSKEECLEDDMNDYMSYVFFGSSGLCEHNIGIGSNYDLNMLFDADDTKEPFWTLL